MVSNTQKHHLTDIGSYPPQILMPCCSLPLSQTPAHSFNPPCSVVTMGCSATLSSYPLLLHHHNLRLPLPHPQNLHLNRRSLLFLSTSIALPTPLSSSTPLPPQPDTTITDRVFIDFSICPSYFLNRSIGDELSLCPDSEPLGRIVVGLYGNLVPITVSNFKNMCTGASGSSYKGTLVHKIFPGQFLMAGKQGRKDKGEVKPPVGLLRNTETVDSKAFQLEHNRAGVVSLCLSENDDEDEVKLNPDYHNVEFLITTGPGPCPQLDYKNIVFGSVVEGLDVVTKIATMATYKPSENIRQYNDLAEFLGDGRAKNARSIWNRPLNTLYMSDCGLLQVAKPTLPPTLP